MGRIVLRVCWRCGGQHPTRYLRYHERWCRRFPLLDGIEKPQLAAALLEAEPEELRWRVTVQLDLFTGAASTFTHFHALNSAVEGTP